nr:integrator complex subunit 12-like [Pocillopora verrucosa]
MGRLGTTTEQRTKMAVASNSVEIDPVFIKALKLLHSKHPDSLDQLRALRDEVVRQHNQQAPTSSKEKPKEGKLGLHTERRPSAIVSTAEVKAKLTEKKFEAEPKHNIPTAKPEPVKSFPIEEASVETLEVGSSMIETVELSSSSFMDQSSSKKAKLQFDVEDVLDEGDLEPPTALQPVVDDLMIDWGSVCSICCRDESKIPGNQLVECHECHSLYHQRCHEPRVVDSEVNDPRHVWYCVQCVRRMREMASSASPKSRPTESATFSKPLSSSHRPVPLAPFKRPSINETKPISSPTMHQSFAIPALSTASSSSAGAGKPSVGSGATSSQNVAAMQHSALKRLQMVKKKAQQRVLNHQQIRIPRR